MVHWKTLSLYAMDIEEMVDAFEMHLYARHFGAR